MLTQLESPVKATAHTPRGRIPSGPCDNEPGDLIRRPGGIGLHIPHRDEIEAAFEANYWGDSGPPTDPALLDLCFPDYRASRREYLSAHSVRGQEWR